MNGEGGLYNMAEPMEQPNYVLQFKEGSYVPKHESILRNNFLGICYVGRRVQPFASMYLYVY